MSLTRFKKLILTAGYLLTASHSLWAFTPVQQPPETSAVPGNLLFALSVEFPTGLQASYNVSNYGAALAYDGYFDNSKCYTYDASKELFSPSSKQNSDADKTCPTSSSQWSGNLLNWLTMTNIDQVRSVMTGGTRDTVSALSTVKGGTQNGDSAAQTILIRSFSDRNSYHVNKWLPNTAAVPTAYRGALVRNGGYGTKIMVVPPANSTQQATTETERDCRRTPGGTKISCWKNTTENTVTVTYKGTSTVVTKGDTWYNIDNKKVDITYSWTTNTTPSNDSFGDMTAAQRQLSCDASTLPTGGSCFNVRVLACKIVTGAGMESNCKGYKDSSKPEGLVQQYANALRYGAFGYLKQDGTGRNGGVLRAEMKSVGKDKAVGDGSVESNTNKEWDETTGVQATDPDSLVSVGVTKSGVINYLNQFGYASGYKANDPVSELYHAALTYLRGLTPPDAYTNFLNDERKDGFPVITGTELLRGKSRDPMINTCQKNFMLTIGDIYTWNDKDITDSEFNVDTLWNKVTTLEGSTDWTGGASEASAYIAGMAYWAHTQDIRPDMDDDPKEGPQTVDSYFVDVLENYNGNNSGTHEQRTLAASRTKTQYWLAAKYGGYDKKTAKTAGNELNPNLDRKSWDADASGTSGYDVPDNWFAGNSPTALRNGLSKAFKDIAKKSKSSSSSSAATTSSRQTSNSQIIYAGYNPQDWTGSVLGCKWKTTGTLPAEAAKRLPNKAECTDAAKTYVTTWDAADWLNEDVKGTGALTYEGHDGRYIISAQPDADTDIALVTGQTFRWASISTAQKSILTGGEDQLKFLRGERKNENVLFRQRPATLLGDIVHSGVTHVAGAAYPLTGSNYDDHNTYRTTTRSRPSVVYVGANDGMLHAFSTTDGMELFAYIPQVVFANLPKLSAVAFTHEYFIDSTPMVGDIETGTNGLGTWKTFLVGGLGAGGKGYYALDISSQSGYASMDEAGFAAKLPQWEFTSVQDPDMGYSFNEPSKHPVTDEFMQIAKVADASVKTGVWRVIVGNGYGSTDGKAILYMLNATTGSAATKLTADAPTTKDSGLSTPTPVDADGDGLVDTVYAGDLKGNMHKFQFSKLLESGKYVLANPSDTGAAWRYRGKVYASGEPIVSAPSVALSCKGTGLNVAFGTGKLNEVNDYTDTAARSFVSLDDLGDMSSLTASDLETITLTPDTLANGAAVRKWAAPSLIDKGWRMAFTDGERVLGNSTQPPKTGAIVFGTTKPSGNICIPGNSAYLMSVNRCSGAPALQVDGNPDVGGYASDSAGEFKVSNAYINPNGDPTTVDNQENVGHKLPTSSAPKGRYSWRELLTK